MTETLFLSNSPVRNETNNPTDTVVNHAKQVYQEYEMVYSLVIGGLKRKEEKNTSK